MKTPALPPSSPRCSASVIFPSRPGTIMSAIAVPLAILIALHGGGAWRARRQPDRAW